MPRPVKWRKVEFLPDINYFVPVGVPGGHLQENVLKVEELEALRLKDIEGLEQDECAARMEISRQTFQRILNEARAKVADSLVNGKAIRVEGGNYTVHICEFECLSCGNRWEDSFENLEKVREGKLECPKCGSTDTICTNIGSFCHGRCYRRGRHGRHGHCGM